MTTSSMHIFEVSDHIEIDRVSADLARIVSRGPEGDFTLLCAEGRRALPAESSSHLNKCQQISLANAFSRGRHKWIWAVAMEPLVCEPPLYRVEVSEEGMAAFNRACSHFNYALFSPDASLVVVCTTDDYIVFIGDVQFVAAAAGSSEAQALDAFHAYALDEAWGEKMRAFLIAVWSAFAVDYPNALPGRFVAFPRKRRDASSGE